MRGRSPRPLVARPDAPGIRQAGTSAPATDAGEAPARSSRGRRAPDLDDPGLTEALAAYMRLMDEVVTESQYCKTTNRGDPDREAYLGDIIERAAARARERRGRNGLRVDGA